MMLAPVPHWPLFKEVLRRQELMDYTMQAYGVDVLTAVRADKGQAYLEARSMCHRCQHVSECREWLASTRQTRGARDFCLNSEFFSRCRATDPEPAAPPSAEVK
jgi:hypothetical protein